MTSKFKCSNRVVTVLIVVAVLCGLIVQSAFAVNVGNATYNVPNPYGAVTLSLNDYSTVRSLYNSASVTFGSGNSVMTYDSQTAEITQGQNILMSDDTILNVISVLQIPAGTYFDYVCDVNYPASEWSSLIINGGGAASVQNVSAAMTQSAYPSTVQLIVNDALVGDVLAYADGFSFPTITIPVTENVYNIGYRFVFTDAVSLREGSGVSLSYSRLCFDITDNAIVTAIEKEQEDPYIPLLMANNSWLQSIFGNSNVTNSLLFDIHEALTQNGSASGELQSVVQSISSAVETLNSISSSMQGNMESIQEETEKYNSIYANETDLQLKEDSQELADTFVSDIFMTNDPNGDLPDGYTAIDFLQTDGNQYIDTGIIPNSNSRIVVDACYLGGSNIYGCRSSTTSRNFSLRVINGNWQPGYGVLGSTGVSADSSWHTFDQNKNVFSIDGQIVHTFDEVSFSAPKSITLGGINASNDFYPGEARFRSCKIYDNGRIVRNLLPCKNPSGEIGMYDLVSASFISCSGTSAPIAGEDVTVKSSTRVSKTDVKDLGKIGDKIKGWFSFDVDINELFSTVESGGSDWYSQETANGIDSVSVIYSNEEDPYSMHDYYDYINYLFVTYGGGAE